jgi:hypothetical protein
MPNGPPVQFLKRAWLNFWFEPSSALNLGICRAMFFGGLFLFYAMDDFSGWGAVDHGFWMPLPLFKRLWALPVETLQVMQIAWKLSLLLSCLGLFTRTAMVGALLLGTYLLGLPHNFGKTHHIDAILVLVMAMLAVSRAGDAFSLDRLLQGHRFSSAPPLSGEYTWPIRGACTVYTLVFFAAGYAKLRSSGLGWIFSDNMQITLVQASYHQAAHDPVMGWNLWLAQFPLLGRTAAAGAVAIELAAPLALFWRPARRVIVPSLILLMIGIRILLGPAFFEFLLCNVFWMDWKFLGERWFARAQPKVDADFMGATG